MIVYRKMTAADIPGGLRLCRIAGWNQVQEDWQQFFDHSPEGAIAAEDETGTVVGTAASINYHGQFSWIGMVLVDPSKRNQGIGSELLKRILALLQQESSIKLDATPAGREIYLKLGFTDEYDLTRMQADNTHLPASHPIGARQMLPDDLDAVFAMDRNVFGADRKSLLKFYFEHFPRLAFVARNASGITGYCFGRIGHHFTSIGPLAAFNMEYARDLAASALQRCEGPVIMDVLHYSPSFIQWLVDAGFSEQRKLIRMYKGNNHSPGNPFLQFSILGPEFG